MQGNYASSVKVAIEMLRKFNMKNCNVATTPIEMSIKLRKCYKPYFVQTNGWFIEISLQ